MVRILNLVPNYQKELDKETEQYIRMQHRQVTMVWKQIIW